MTDNMNSNSSVDGYPKSLNYSLDSPTTDIHTPMQTDITQPHQTLPLDLLTKPKHHQSLPTNMSTNSRQQPHTQLIDFSPPLLTCIQFVYYTDEYKKQQKQ